MPVAKLPAMVGARHIDGPFAASPSASWPAAALFVVGTVFVILLLLHFLREERYRRPPRPERGVEFVAARRAVEAETSSLAEEVVLIAEKEGSLARLLEKETLGEQARRPVDRLLREAALRELWRSFIEALALAELDPVRAYGELRRLSPAAETALEKLRKAEEIAHGTAPRGEEEAGTPNCG